MLSKLTLSKNKGFTLVELLIVVAIIGILATIGIPTFNTYRSRAMKSGATSMLGGILTAEQAFFSEYSTYGTFLTKIGFDVPQNAGATYAVGFPTAACASLGGAAPQPPIGSGNGPRLNALYATYYSDAAAYTSITGRIFNAGDACAVGDLGPANDGTNFTAVATGAIVRGTNSASAADVAAAPCNAVATIDQCQSVFTATPAAGIVQVIDPIK